MSNQLNKELGTNFIEYAMAANTDRAIPNAVDGLKPVAKRIIYQMYSDKYNSKKAHVKCAKAVGSVMGTLHPHGDSSIYEALVRLAQPWSLRYPLIDFHGNMGSIHGDAAASYRYTECRLGKLAEKGLLDKITEDAVDFVPNYDETSSEPIALPAIFPNLLCNPNSGIGVAMACNFAPHNLNEVAAAINSYLDGQEPMLPGPDFPSGGIVLNGADVPDIMRTGRGTVYVRAKHEIDGRNIIFTEIPYGTTTEDLCQRIGDLDEKDKQGNKKLEGLSNIRDESNKKGVRIVVECKKDANPDFIAEQLFLLTPLQSTFSYNQVALVDKEPMELNLKDCIEIYVKHNLECIKRETAYNLNQKKKRLNIVVGLLAALNNIDAIIKTIKEAESSKVAKELLMKGYDFNEAQADAILNLKLSSLAKLEGTALEEEQETLTKTIQWLEDILGSEQEQIKVLKERLAEIVKEFGDERRTVILNQSFKKETKEPSKPQLVEEKVLITLDKAGVLTKEPISKIDKNVRGTKGPKIKTPVVCGFVGSNLEDFFVVGKSGKVWRGRTYEIGGKESDSGSSNSASMFNLKNEDYPIFVGKLPQKDYLYFVTKKGKVKKSSMADYENIRSGSVGIKLREDDEVVAIFGANDDEYICICSSGGSIVRTAAQEFNPQGRATIGVNGIKLGKNEYVISAYLSEKYSFIVTEENTGKMILNSDIPEAKKGAKGVEVFGGIAAAAPCKNISQTVFIFSPTNKLCLTTGSFGVKDRASKGVICMKGSLPNFICLED